LRDHPSEPDHAFGISGRAQSEEKFPVNAEMPKAANPLPNRMRKFAIFFMIAPALGMSNHAVAELVPALSARAHVRDVRGMPATTQINRD
jgi:hypothetical protein